MFTRICLFLLNVQASKKRPTQPVADRWVRGAIFEFFGSFEFFPFRRRVSSHPPATNGGRWAAYAMI
jgi:hypothetical protein